MTTLYVIQSLDSNFRYVGITNNLSDRLRRHNQNRNFSTKHRGPFKLIYTEQYPDYSEARKREKFLKSGQGRKWLDDLK